MCYCSYRHLFILVLLLGVLAGSIQAQTLFTFNGRLVINGTPANGTYDFEFLLFNATTGGMQVGPSLTVMSVPVTNGSYSVALNLGAQSFADAPLYIQVAYRLSGKTSFTNLSGRVLLTARFAITAASAMGLQGNPVAATAPAAGQALVWNGSAWCPTTVSGGGGTTYQAGAGLTLSGTVFSIANAGVVSSMLASGSVTSAAIAGGAVTASALASGAVTSLAIANGAVTSTKLAAGAVTSAAIANGAVTNPTIAASAVTVDKISPSGASSGQALMSNGSTVTWGNPVAGGLLLPFTGSSSADPAFTITNTGSGIAGFFNATSSGYGVWGQSVSGYGVVGISSSAAGVYAQSGSGSGVEGFSSSSNGVYGASTNSDGVYGYSSNSDGGHFVAEGSGNGVYASSSSGYAVYGISNSYGISGGSAGYFIAQGSIGFGVYAQSSSMDGGYFLAEGNGDGVYGQSNYGDGGGFNGAVDGIVVSGGINGIVASGGAWAGSFGGDIYVADSGSSVFTGNVQVNGTLTAGAKNFKIDHPLDPANKYLLHSCVESDQMKTFYDGHVTTDANGNATVTLPGWFEALNKDFEYHLTVIGQFAQAIISHEIQNRQFAIQTDKPYVKVSWQVTGVRQDAYAMAHPLEVEQVKPEQERGKFLHPTELGYSESLGIDYERGQQPRRQGHTAP